MSNVRIKLKRDTTAHWNSATGFIPLEGEVIIYTDGRSVTENNLTVYYPTIKIGDGLAYVQDLPFVDDDTRTALLAHMNNQGIHVTPQDKTFWNDKVNIDDSYEVINDELENETLVFSRVYYTQGNN